MYDDCGYLGSGKQASAYAEACLLVANHHFFSGLLVLKIPRYHHSHGTVIHHNRTSRYVVSGEVSPSLFTEHVFVQVVLVGLFLENIKKLLLPIFLEIVVFQIKIIINRFRVLGVRTV